MYNLNDFCELLTAAVLLKNVPNYKIKSEINFKDELDLLRKVEFRYKQWISKKSLKKNTPPLTCIGCCEIDQFTGNDLLKIFYDFMSSNKYRGAGKFLFFSKNQNFCAAMFFTKSKPLFITPFVDENDTKQLPFRYLFTKLFDRDETLRRRANITNQEYVYYQEENVSNLRSEAIKQFPIFLNKRIADYQLFAFGYSFLGLLSLICYMSSPKSKLSRRLSSHFGLKIPFAACVRFAFAQNQIEQLTVLCGELCNMTTFTIRAESMTDVTRNIIFK